MSYLVKMFLMGVLMVFSLAMPAGGTVVHAPNLDVVEAHIEKLDQNALVVFDVDLTLILPDDQLFSPSGELQTTKLVHRLECMGEEGAILGSSIFQRLKVSLMDPKILEILTRLKEKKVKTIALTAMDSGKFGVIPSMEDWRIQQLGELGVDFSWSFPNVAPFVVEGFEGQRAHPVFKSGVLASSKYPKGRVLVEFLKKMQYKPSEIVFIDDRAKEIDSVEREVEKENIPHTSFHYTAATNRTTILDQAMIDAQIEHLFQHGEWFSDEEIKKQ